MRRHAIAPGPVLCMVLIAGGCGDRSVLPAEPTSEPDPQVEAAFVMADPPAAAGVAIHDALIRIIPGLGQGDNVQALHDAFDLVADALEANDSRLDQRIARAEKALLLVVAEAAPGWEPELEALNLALGTATTRTADGSGGPGKSEP